MCVHSEHFRNVQEILTQLGLFVNAVIIIYCYTLFAVLMDLIEDASTSLTPGIDTCNVIMKKVSLSAQF